MKHELPKLPWQADALTGAISATTIDFHCARHSQSYSLLKMNNLQRIVS